MFHSIKKLKKDFDPSPYRLWYNKWVKKNARGKVLDVGKSTFWDYGYPTIDTRRSLKPTYVGNIEKTKFKNNEFDLVLCNGMYEFVENPQKMIDEVLRIGKKAIFGFVGEEYKPYRKPWHYFDFYEKLPPYECHGFNKMYYFIICQK